MIDWKFALGTASRLSRPGPDLDDAAVEDVMGELRESAAMAVAPVREFTGLTPAWHTPVLVVDRTRWVESNLQTFEVVLEPFVARLSKDGKAPSGLGGAIGPKLTGVEVGALLSFLASKILGQFDPFWTSPTGEPGRLLLVAPNIVMVERELDVDSSDFRRWVCLHEETHRAQFTGVPWMRDTLMGLLDEFTGGMETEQLGEQFGEAAAEVLRIARGTSDRALSEVFQNADQRRILDKITGIMSLLEGHADVVMDDIGPELIGSVDEIRRKFDRRRASATGLNAVMRRLLGLEAKMRQYRDGAGFVRSVHDIAGREGFDAIWEDPDHLPSRSEISDPAAWIARVHG